MVPIGWSEMCGNMTDRDKWGLLIFGGRDGQTIWLGYKGGSPEGEWDYTIEIWEDMVERVGVILGNGR